MIATATIHRRPNLPGQLEHPGPQFGVVLEVNRSHQADGFDPVTLVSADRDLNDAATAEGLTVDNPNSQAVAAGRCILSMSNF